MIVAADLLPGLPLGIAIGVVSGAAFLLLLYTAFNHDLDLAAVLQMSAELLAVPAFWFGGPWLTTKVTEIDLDAMLETYVASLAVTFVLLLIYPLVRLIVRIGNRIGQVESD